MEGFFRLLVIVEINLIRTRFSMGKTRSMLYLYFLSESLKLNFGKWQML